MGFLGFVGGLAGEIVKDATGIDIEKGINTIKEGGLEEALYEMRDDAESKAYLNFRQQLRSLSDADFRRVSTDNMIDIQIKAYEDERRRRRL